MKPAVRAGLAVAMALWLPATAYLVRGHDVLYWILTDDLGVSVTATIAAILAVAFFPWTKRAILWTLIITFAAFFSTVPIQNGLAARTGVLVVLGAWAGSRSLVNGESPAHAESVAFSATFLGTLLGVDILWPLIHGMPEAPGAIGVIGGAGIADALFAAPVLALAWTALWRALVEMGPGVPDSDGHPIMGLIRNWLGHRCPRETTAWIVAGWTMGAAAWGVTLFGYPLG